MVMFLLDFKLGLSSSTANFFARPLPFYFSGYSMWSYFSFRGLPLELPLGTYFLGARSLFTFLTSFAILMFFCFGTGGSVGPGGLPRPRFIWVFDIRSARPRKSFRNPKTLPPKEWFIWVMDIIGWLLSCVWYAYPRFYYELGCSF